MSRGSTKIGLAGITIALLAAGIVIYSRSDRDQAPEAAALQPIPVIATTVQQRDMPIILTGLGTVTASEHGNGSQPDHRAADQR